MAKSIPIAAAVAAVAAVALIATVVDDGPAEEVATDFPTATTVYDGPVYDADARFGAAGLALDCTPAAGQFARAEVYGDGATSDSVDEALETANSEGLFLFAPTDELRVARAERDRVMLTHESGGRILMALVFRDGPATEGAGGPGWYLESAARCDFAEFPEAFAEKAGYQLWRAADGEPVPVTRVYSAPGPEHCDWQSMVFLYLDDRDAFVRDPDRELEQFVAGPYRHGIELPADARDTGYERAGQHLWLSPDRAYAYVGTPSSVEAWPRFDAGCE